MVSFNLDAGSFGTLDPPLSPWIRETIVSMGFRTMTPVQASVIPLFSKNKDVVVEAVTGSGKTLSFVIPILERLSRRESPLGKHDVGAIIITPTRELATQIHAVVSSFIASQAHGEPSEDADAGPSPKRGRLREPLLLIGGNTSGDSASTSAASTFREVGADVLIGTPGRMEEFLLGKSSMPQKKGSTAKAAKGSVRNIVNLKPLDVLVLDEADRLLDLGFSPVLTSILSALPKQRRTGLFSATMTSALASLIRVGLRNPVKVVVRTSALQTAGKGKQKAQPEEASGSAPEGLKSGFVVVPEGRKISQLQRLLRQSARQGARKVVVFFATCAEVDHWYRVLTRLEGFADFTFHSLHGSLAPPRRQATYHAFTTALTIDRPAVLLTTDVAARGLDVPEVDVVVQMEPPSDPRVFAHRVGRTARAGREGTAIVMLRKGREEEYVDFMRVRRMPLAKMPYLDGDLSPTSDETDDGAALALGEQVGKVVLTDRALHESVVKALVSNVRFYSKHEASYIFRVADLDLVAIGRSMGIVRLPKMPELRGCPEGGWLRSDVDWDAYAYADKTRESQRLETLRTQKRPAPEDADSRQTKKPKSSNVAWSAKADRKVAKELKKEKRLEKRKVFAERDEQPQGDEEGQGEEVEQDWKDLLLEKAGERRRRSKGTERQDLAVAAFDGLV